MDRPILFAGDCHGQFRQVHQAAGHTRAASVILLGDMEPTRPLEADMAPLAEKGIEWYFIGGNHDSDSQEMARRVWNPNTASHDLHVRVVTLHCGLRVTGIQGVFRGDIYYPGPGGPNGGRSTHYSRADLARATPRQHRFHPLDIEPRHHYRHFGSIFEDEIDRLSLMAADILVTHEAPSYHPTAGFKVLDDVARALGVRLAVHGHQHDALDGSSWWKKQGFESHGVGLRGVSAWWPSSGRWEVIVPGEIDDERAAGRKVEPPCESS